MRGRNLETRVAKLESRTARPDETLVVWRRPSGNVSEALEGVGCTRGDKVICGEWFEDSPLPEPRWYRDRLSEAMPASEYQQIMLTIERIALVGESERNDVGLAPFPSFAGAHIKEMTDAELIHALIGVST